MRWLTRALAGLALLFFLAPGALIRDSIPPPNNSQTITIRRLPDLPAVPVRLQGGPLVLRDGWELDSNNSDFGGYSGLLALGPGRFLALSDAGMVMGFTLARGPRIRDSFIAPLPLARHDHLARRQQDSESITRDPDTGRFWVGYEQIAAIRRFTAALSRGDGVVKPAAMRGWPDNGGAEALVRLRDGRFLVFAEKAGARHGGTQALLYRGDPIEAAAPPLRFRYRPPKPDYSITDAAQLPDGRLITLHRRFTLLDGVSAKIGIADPAEIRAGALLRPQIIATLRAPLPVDNMEGVAVTQSGPHTYIWLISDDNFAPFQRTILLKLELLGPDDAGWRRARRVR